MAKHFLPLFMAAAAALSSLILTPTAAANKILNTTTPTAYDMLAQYGFPRGLLPQGVQSYTLQPDGAFEVRLASECSFRVSSYSVHYSSRVAGNIRSGSISGIEGVRVKILIAWFGVREIARDGGDGVRLHAGPVAKTLSAGDFSASPQCG